MKIPPPLEKQPGGPDEIIPARCPSITPGPPESPLQTEIFSSHAQNKLFVKSNQRSLQLLLSSTVNLALFTIEENLPKY